MVDNSLFVILIVEVADPLEQDPNDDEIKATPKKGETNKHNGTPESDEITSYDRADIQARLKCLI